MAGWPLGESSGQATHRKMRKAGQSRALNSPNGNTMKFENISEAELDARLKALQESINRRKGDDTAREKSGSDLNTLSSTNLVSPLMPPVR
jgi:uncharacterized small protein (DUF1192 family)